MDDFVYKWLAVEFERQSVPRHPSPPSWISGKRLFGSAAGVYSGLSGLPVKVGSRREMAHGASGYEGPLLPLRRRARAAGRKALVLASAGAPHSAIGNATLRGQVPTSTAGATQHVQPLTVIVAGVARQDGSTR